MMRPTDRAQLHDTLTRTLKSTSGPISSAHVAHVAGAFGITPRTVYRQVALIRSELVSRRLPETAEAAGAAEAVADPSVAQPVNLDVPVQDPQAPPGNWWASEADTGRVLAELAAAPTVKAAWTALHQAGVVTCTYPTFTRQLRAKLEPSVGAALTVRGKNKGREAHVAASLYCRREVPERNASWQADCSEVPVRVRPDNGGPAFKPWLVAIIDEATRVLIAAVLVPGHPTAVDIIATLALAIRGSTTEFGDFIGGIPETIRWDNGREFVNQPVTHACIRLGIGAHPSSPYSGWQKGKVERFHQTIQRELFDRQPGAVHGPKTFSGKRPWVGADEDLRCFSSLALLVDEYRRIYNHERKHSAIGTTPLQAWRMNPAPLTYADPLALHPLMLALPRHRKVGKDGISYANIKFVAPALASWRGRYVEIRVLPQDQSFISVFDLDTGAYICDAHPSPNLTVNERRAILHERTINYTRIREALTDGARRRREEAIIAGAIDAETGIPGDARVPGPAEDGLDDGFGLTPNADALLDLLDETPPAN